MKDKKKGLLHLFIIIAIIGLCSYITLVGITSAHKGSAKNIKLGLDLAGGVSITYEATKDNPTATERYHSDDAAACRGLQHRVFSSSGG